MSEVIQKLEDWLSKVYNNNIHIACLELPILKILVDHNGWLDRNEIIKQLSEYGSFERGGLSFDHLWSQRFGKGEEKDILNSIVEHDGQNAGDKKTKYKIKNTIDIKLLQNLLEQYNTNTIQHLTSKRLDYVSNNINNLEQEFVKWLKVSKKLSDNTCRNYTNRLKNKIPDKLYETSFKNDKSSLYIYDIEELQKINVLFNINQYGLQDWNRTPTIGQEAWNALKYLIEYKLNSINDEEGNPKMLNDTKQTLNQILYGPPGTGKTYHTIDKALDIIDNEFYQQHKEETPENRKALKDKFEEYKKAGQIEFVTFHQSYGYEEFVEGIKAKTTDKGIEYKIESGIFKKLCEKAEKNITNEDEVSFDEAYSQYLNSFDNGKELQTKTGASFKIKKNARDNFSLLTGSEFKKNGSIIKERLEGYVLFDKITDWASYLPIIGDEIKSLMKNKSNKNTQNYILIIDEINRGNISKIFGELITLIEPSKRIGADEEIRVKLPYSGDNEEAFGVPSNLYILGTMNTADRSIAPIDTALRRRFVFEEMVPNPDLLTKKKTPDIYDEVNLKSLLEAINTRIEYLYDRDHTIGHAYLIDVKDLNDLKFAFKNKIIPLLAEYFYEDWENIDLVLNKNGMIEEEKSNSDYLKNITKINGKKIYKVSDKNWEVKNFEKIYNDKALDKQDEPTE